MWLLILPTKQKQKPRLKTNEGDQNLRKQSKPIREKRKLERPTNLFGEK